MRFSQQEEEKKQDLHSWSVVVQEVVPALVFVPRNDVGVQSPDPASGRGKALENERQFPGSSCQHVRAVAARVEITLMSVSERRRIRHSPSGIDLVFYGTNLVTNHVGGNRHVTPRLSVGIIRL